MALSIRFKLYLVVFLLLVPLALMSGLFVQQSFKDIDFAAAERGGTDQLRALWGDLAAFARNPATPPEVADAVAALAAERTTPSIGKAAAALGAAAGTGDAETVAAAFRDLATAVGNDSNLILDPDLDSFYVMDTVVVRLPDLIGRAATLDLMARSQQGLADLDDDAKAAFVIELGQVKTAWATVASSTDTAVANNADGTVAAALSDPTRALGTKVDAFVSAAMTVANGLRNPQIRASVDMAPLTAARGALVAAVDDYWKVSAGVLDHLLEQRIAGFTGRLWLMLGLALAVAALAVGLAVLIARSVVRGIGRLDAAIRALADADIHAPVAGADGRDELARIAQAVAYFRDRTIEKLAEANSEERRREIIQGEKAALAAVADRLKRSVGAVVQGINELAGGIRAAIGVVAENAAGTRGELSASLDRLGRANGDMGVVVSAVTELSASIAEIADQTGLSARNAATARTRADQARAVGEKLAGASEKIGEVSALISSIAQQTNLLALNATIEAARAGAAGKGFAVVAAEVKQLADQTGRATGEIERQVEEIRAAARDVGASVAEITQSIDGMSQLSTAIAGAVEEQSTATAEITASLDRTAGTTADVVASLDRLPALATGTEQAAGSLATLSQSLVGRVKDLETEVDALLRDLTDRRRHPRRDAALRVSITVGGRSLTTELHDLSRSGARLTGLAGVAVGEVVKFTAPNLAPVDAKVIWTSGTLAGLQFRGRELTAAELEAVLGLAAA